MIKKQETFEETEFIIEEDSEEENELTTYSYISNHLYFEYFVGYEIAALLGYKNTTRTIIDNVSKCNQLVFRDFPGVKIPELDPRTILITRDGVIEILLKTRKRISLDVLHILKKFNIDTTNRKCLTKEQQTLSTITDVFKTEKFEDQFKIGPYYLDLYFTEHKIVIECDENGHADRKPYKEEERMEYVNFELDIDDSYWIRFNPDENDFDISKVIGKIYRKIDEIKQNKYLKNEEENKKKYDEELKLKEEENITSKINELNMYAELQGKCRKYDLDQRGNKTELYNRVSHYLKTGEKKTYKTLTELRTICKEYNLIYTGNKDVLEERINHYLETGENKRKFDEKKQIDINAGSIVDINEQNNILNNLEKYTNCELLCLCKLHNLVQQGTNEILRERIRNYFKKGINDNQRRKDVYQFDYNGKFLNHYNTISEAKDALNICINTISDAIDKNYTMNNFIFRSRNVIFSEIELNEIKKCNKKSKRQLTGDDHIEIKKLFNSGESKESLMEKYSISKSQILRIIKK